jgi:hypothetical protein
MKSKTGTLVKLTHFEPHRASVLAHNGENARKVPAMYLVGVAPSLPPMSARGPNTGSVNHSVALSREFVEQRLCFLKVTSVEALGEPTVNRREQSAGLSALALVSLESGETDRGP